MLIDIFRFCLGGLVVLSVCVVLVSEKRLEWEIFVDGVRFVLKNKYFFKEYYIRVMRWVFKEKVNNFICIFLVVLDMIYKEFILDVIIVVYLDI